MKIASVESLTSPNHFHIRQNVQTFLRHQNQLVGSFRFIVFVVVEDIALSICDTIRNCAYDNMGDNVRGATIIIFVRTVCIKKRIRWTG